MPAATGSLTHLLSAIRDPAVGRAVVGERLARLEATAFARELEALVTLARAGQAPARAAMVAVAGFLAHATDSAGLARLAEAGAAAVAASLDAASAVLDQGPATRALPARARLAEVGIPVFTVLSGPPPRRADETSAEWYARLAWLRVAPIRSGLLRRRVEGMLRHHDPVFIARLLDQRWLRAKDVVEIASRRPTLPALQRAIAVRDPWLSDPSVRRALAENPYSPPGLASALRATIPSA